MHTCMCVRSITAAPRVYMHAYTVYIHAYTVYIHAYTVYIHAYTVYIQHVHAAIVGSCRR
jgi:hypothetical protein